MTKKPKATKRISFRKFAPVGLWISGLAILIAVIMLVVNLLVFIGLYSPPDQKLFNMILLVSLGVAVIGLALFAIFDPQRIRIFLNGRQARHGSNAVILTTAFCLILLVVNVMAYENPIQWDWTEDKQNTLARETIDILEALPNPVHAIGFFTSRVSNINTLDLFNKIKVKSSNFSFEFINPEINPVKAQQYKITQDASVVLTMLDRQELLVNPTEQEFTNALIRLMNPGQRNVYFLAGHGERDIENSGDRAFTRARTVLESKNYTVKVLNLLAQNKIPDDALALIINAPSKPISIQEFNLLKAYVENGRGLVVLEDISVVSETGESFNPLHDYLSKTWGMQINNDLVIDPSSSQIDFAVEYTYGSHPITDKLADQNMVSFFPAARSINLDEDALAGKATSLVMTIPESWGETDFVALQNNEIPSYASVDYPGPLTIAAAAEDATTNSRIVVVGDADFASDNYFDQYGNGDLFINMVDWAAGQEDLINLTSSQVISRQMRIPNNLTILLLTFLFVILIPGLIITGGVASWLVRRSRG